jgi:hypothetical protein
MVRINDLANQDIILCRLPLGNGHEKTEEIGL